MVASIELIAGRPCVQSRLQAALFPSHALTVAAMWAITDLDRFKAA
jgi:hypothetical protein